MNPHYKLAFKIAAIAVPPIMAVVGALYGDIKPAARDLCNVVLPGELTTPVVGDAGAPR